MPCDTVTQEAVEQAKREAAYKALEARLKGKSASIMKLGNQVSIEGWDERGGWCDSCAINRLRHSEDFEVRTMVANAVPQTAGITFGHGH